MKSHITDSLQLGDRSQTITNSHLALISFQFAISSRKAQTNV